MLHRSPRRTLAALAVLALFAVASGDTLRIATWNISQYTGGRAADVQNVVYGTYQGRSMQPDVIMAQEIQSSAAVTSFLSVLNGVAGGPTDWKAAYAPLTGTSVDNDQVVFYRSGKVSVPANPTLVVARDGTAGTARNVYRWDLQLAGLVGETLSVYDVHLKSGSADADVARRKVATDAIRADANALDARHHMIVGGDFNVQNSSEADYVSLTGSQSRNSGRFFDPIGTPGDWNNNPAYRFVHTQDPSGPGGMDDRHDQLLLDATLGDGVGLDYAGSFGTAYSTTTWNDPNHSYRAWGNDGTSYGNSLTVAGNAMVGPSIAQSLVNAATTGGGHLPVFLDLKYSPVPEPGTWAALGLGAVAGLRRRRRA